MSRIDNYAVRSGRVLGEDDKEYNIVDLLQNVGGTGEPGPKGDPGPAGKGVKSIALTTTDGAVTGDTVTYTDNTTAAIAVTEG